MNYFILAIKNSFNFRGLSSKKEFWGFFWVNFIIQILLYSVLLFLILSDGSSNSFEYENHKPEVSNITYIIGLFHSIYTWLTLIPYISLSVRRLNELKKPWYNIFFNLIPIIGWVYFLYLMAQKSENIEESKTSELSEEELSKKNKDFFILKIIITIITLYIIFFTGNGFEDILGLFN